MILNFQSYFLYKPISITIEDFFVRNWLSEKWVSYGIIHFLHGKFFVAKSAAVAFNDIGRLTLENYFLFTQPTKKRWTFNSHQSSQIDEQARNMDCLP
jgi:hypothetical protein